MQLRAVEYLENRDFTDNGNIFQYEYDVYMYTGFIK